MLQEVKTKMENFIGYTYSTELEAKDNSMDFSYTRTESQDGMHWIYFYRGKKVPYQPEMYRNMKVEEDSNLSTMYKNLTPQGKSPLVRLFLYSSYYNEDFVRECIDELARKVQLEESLTALEKLAVSILRNSAGIEK